MGAIKFLAAPIRTIVRFPLFQFVVVVAVILFLQAADDNSVLGQIYYSLDKLVDYTMRSLSAVFNVKSFTKSWLTTGFWIAYVYLVCWLILLLMRLAIIAVMDLIARSNAFWLRNAIARERGIVAYSAWVPFERIRPANIPQREWEERFAWPANNKPPYLPLVQRIVRGVIGYVIVIVGTSAALQVFTPFPVLTWLGEILKTLRP
jgi:small-conductance mechanosensitive channel